MRLIDIRDAAFGWSRQTTLFRVARLCIRSGDKVILIGPNGSGKTTLLNNKIAVFFKLLPGGGTANFIGDAVRRHILLLIGPKKLQFLLIHGNSSFCGVVQPPRAGRLSLVTRDEQF